MAMYSLALLQELCILKQPTPWIQTASFLLLTDSLHEEVNHIANHVNPKPIEVAERCKFNQLVHQDGQSVNYFVAQLRQTARHCNRLIIGYIFS